MGLFGDLFDFNNDGKLDSFEKAAELSFIFGAACVAGLDEEDEYDENDYEDEEW